MRLSALPLTLLTVTAPDGEIRPGDIPPELGGQADPLQSDEWTTALSRWAERSLAAANPSPLLKRALPEFERALSRAALNSADGHKQEAARLLGWGRNTLARKMRDLDLDRN